MKRVLKKVGKRLFGAAQPNEAEAGEPDCYRDQVALPEMNQPAQEYCTRLSMPQKERLAAEFLYSCLQKIAGYEAFRDLGGRGLSVHANEVRFEKMEITPDPISNLSTLQECYGNKQMAGNAGATLEQLSGIDFSSALNGLKRLLIDELRMSTLTFKQQGTKRHVCRAQKTYNTVNLPQVRIPSEDAQRDCAKRAKKFGLNESLMAGKTLLDLGSNIGGMVFESQQFSPAFSRGVEYDDNKVKVARLVGALNDLRNVVFEQGDIDKLRTEDVDGGADVVFALAINKHRGRG